MPQKAGFTQPVVELLFLLLATQHVKYSHEAPPTNLKASSTTCVFL